MSDHKVIRVDASRLRYKGGGDIWRSISIHLIPEGRISSPFQSNGMLLTACGSKTDEEGFSYTPAYQLVAINEYPREATTYQEKTLLTMPDNWYEADQRKYAGDYARNDPNGFYDGMIVKQGSKSYVLMGPPVRIYGVAAALQQSLFA